MECSPLLATHLDHRKSLGHYTENELDGFLYNLLHLSKVLDDIVALTNVPADRYHVGLLLHGLQESPPPGGVQEVQVDVGEPR